MSGAETVLIVFARAPQPGAVKTRLVPLLGADRAAALHADLVRHTLDTAIAAALPRLELHCTPATGDAFFRDCRSRYGVALEAQAGSGLGERMRAAFQRALKSHARALLIGSDCPGLTARHLRQAEQALRDGADAVFVPCEDGGYALIGLRRPDASLFEDIAWGTGSVMAATRRRLQALGWSWRELDTLWDVDRPEDYQRLVASRLLER